MEPSKLPDAVVFVLTAMFPGLPVAEAAAAYERLFGAPLKEVTEAELDAFQVESLRLQRAAQ